MARKGLSRWSAYEMTPLQVLGPMKHNRISPLDGSPAARAPRRARSRPIQEVRVEDNILLLVVSFNGQA